MNTGPRGGRLKALLLGLGMVALLEGGLRLVPILAPPPFTLELARVDDGSEVDRLVEGVAHDEGFHAVLELADEDVGDGFLDEEARARATALAVVKEDRIGGPGDCLLEVWRVFKDDVGRFAAKFQS